MMEVQELTDIETVEVSLVDKGANERSFAIRKSEKNQMDLVNAILAAPFEQRDKVSSCLKKQEMSEQAQEAIQGAVQLLSAVQEEIPENLMKEVLGLAGMLKEEEDPTEKQEEEEEEESDLPVEQAEDEEEMQKRLDSLPVEMRGMVEELWKSNRESVTKQRELEAKIQKAEDEKRLGECVSIARSEFPQLPAKAEELGAFLKSLDGVSPNNANFVRSLLKSANELISQGGITAEIGKSNTASQELDAVTKAERMADELVQKEGITKAAAKGKVWKNNPELYAAYLQEKGQ